MHSATPLNPGRCDPAAKFTRTTLQLKEAWKKAAEGESVELPAVYNTLVSILTGSGLYLCICLDCQLWSFNSSAALLSQQQLAWDLSLITCKLVQISIAEGPGVHGKLVSIKTEPTDQKSSVPVGKTVAAEVSHCTPCIASQVLYSVKSQGLLPAAHVLAWS